MTKYIVNKNSSVVVNVIAKTVKFGTSGIVDKVVVYKNKDNLSCKVQMRKNKIPEMGDKFASRLGRICGMLLEQQEMPFTKEELYPI